MKQPYVILDGRGTAGPRAGWRAATLENVEATRDALRLAPLPSPPKPLTDATGAFGGMVDPTGVAVAPNGDIYVSDTATHRIFRIRCQSEAAYLPCLGGEGSAPRRLRAPRGVAISRTGTLYVADSGNDRIQLFDLETLKLLDIWSSLREPWDVAVDPRGNVWIAEKGSARLQRYDCRRRRFTIIDGTEVAAHWFEVNYGPDARKRFVFLPLRGRLEQWLVPSASSPADLRIVATDVRSVPHARETLEELLHAKGAKKLFLERTGVYPAALEAGEPMLEPTDLAIDREGRVFVIDRQKNYVRILDAHGRLLQRVVTRDEVSATFEPTAIAIDAGGKLLLASADGIHRFIVTEAAQYDRCIGGWTGFCYGMSADDRGRIFAAGSSGIAESGPSPGFETSGVYLSNALDSAVDRCTWDRLAFEFQENVPTSTAVTVRTFTSNTLISDADVAALDDEEWRSESTNAGDSLVRSQPGRYLWLQIRFAGDGASTPALHRIKAFFPRSSYLQYLPAIYQSEPISRDFLDRFLRIFQTIFESFETKIESFADFLDPQGTPSGFLEWLGSWIAMTFDPDMTEDVRVRLLRAAPELYRKRGTASGLRLFLQLAFGIDARILEHYRLRKWAYAGGGGTALGTRSQLWGGCLAPRMQLDVYASIGEASLIGPGDPLLDPFAIDAHKFSVYLPASALTSAHAVRALIEREKPAHTDYTLVTLRPRFRLGVQSTLGLDSVVGAYPRLVLGQCGNLGFDALLGGASEHRNPPPMVVGARSRVGVSTIAG